MKLNHLFLSFLFIASAHLFGSQFATAEVTIKFGASVDVLAVNESKPDIKSGGFFSDSKTIALPNGINQIVFRHNTFFDVGSEVQSISSDVIIARFEASDTKLEFEFPKFTDAEMAKEKINSLNWSLVTTNGEKIKHQEGTLVKMGTQFGRDYVAEARQYNKTNGVAAVKTLIEEQVTQAKSTLAVAQTMPVNQVPLQTTTDSSAPNTPKSTAEEMLHFWYAKADDDTKARFKAFINQQ